MELEEAINIIKNLNDGYTFKACNACSNYNETTLRCDKEKCEELIAIDTVISELFAMQNLLDEKNEELDRLQRENTMLENTKNNCPHFNTSGISCDKKFCNLDDYISKNKLKDCLEDIENYFENVSVPYEDIEFIKEKRKDLLKEE